MCSISVFIKAPFLCFRAELVFMFVLKKRISLMISWNKIFYIREINNQSVCFHANIFFDKQFFSFWDILEESTNNLKFLFSWVIPERSLIYEDEARSIFYLSSQRVTFNDRKKIFLLLNMLFYEQKTTVFCNIGKLAWRLKRLQKIKKIFRKRYWQISESLL